MVDKKDILSILKKISGRRILVVGDIIADEYIFGNTYRLSREAPIPIIRFQSSEIKPGGAGNVAMNVAAMGGSVSIAGILGNDPYGRELLNIFKRNSVSTEMLCTNSLRTIIKTRVLAGDINTAMQQIFRLDRGISGGYPEDVYTFLKNRIKGQIRNFDAVVLSDYGEGLFSEEFIRWILKTASGMKVIADSRFSFKSYRKVTALTPNMNEISQIYGRYIQTDEELRKAALKLRKITGARYVLLKKGRNGIAILKENAKLTSFSAFGNTEVADVTGAGDTVLAAFSLAISAGIRPEKAACLANIAGGIKVQKRGTVPVNSTDILRAVNGKKV